MTEPAAARTAKQPALKKPATRTRTVKKATVKKAAVTKAAVKNATAQRARAEGVAGLFRVDDQVERVICVLGNNTVARVLGVSTSQPSRWRSGREQVSPENRRKLSDLDHVLDRLLLELYPDLVAKWLTSPNAHLGGARPADVLQLRGAVAVLPAIDALAVGAFA